MDTGGREGESEWMNDWIQRGRRQAHSLLQWNPLAHWFSVFTYVLCIRAWAWGIALAFIPGPLPQWWSPHCLAITMYPLTMLLSLSYRCLSLSLLQRTKWSTLSFILISEQNTGCAMKAAQLLPKLKKRERRREFLVSLRCKSWRVPSALLTGFHTE